MCVSVCVCISAKYLPRNTSAGSCGMDSTVMGM